MPIDPFVNVTALTSLGSIQYLDARDRARFDAGHAPGAVHVPVGEWDKAAKAADIGFAGTAYWDDAIRSLGVDPSAIAVAYDDGRMTNPARQTCRRADGGNRRRVDRQHQLDHGICRQRQRPSRLSCV